MEEGWSSKGSNLRTREGKEWQERNNSGRSWRRRKEDPEEKDGKVDD
jgi:hypothetical protein